MDRHVLDQVEVLDGDRHPEEWRGVLLDLAGEHSRLGLVRLLQRQLGGHGHVGADIGVQSPDAVEVVLGDLDRRDLPAAYGRRLLQSGEIMYFCHAPHGRRNQQGYLERYV
nr:hypothetical protein GCM10020093_048220 [Planobispora longispora]